MRMAGQCHGGIIPNDGGRKIWPSFAMGAWSVVREVWRVGYSQRKKRMEIATHTTVTAAMMVTGSSTDC